MVVTNSQFRVDNTDAKKAVKLLNSYCANHDGKYLICLETAEKSGKLHLQGWVCHNSADNTYRKHFARHYPEFDHHGKCFSLVEKPDRTFNDWVRYIVNNDNKEDIHFDSPNLFTNYTLEEFADFKLLDRHLKREEFLKQLKTRKPNDWYFKLLDRIEEVCIANDNRIDYAGARALYLEDPPKFFNEHQMHRTLIGIFTRLENKYPKNTRAKNRMIHAVADLGHGLYDPVINYSSDT